MGAGKVKINTTRKFAIEMTEKEFKKLQDVNIQLDVWIDEEEYTEAYNRVKKEMY